MSVGVDEPTIYVITSQEREWMLPGFAYLFNRSWSATAWVSVVCYGRNYRSLPDNFASHHVTPSTNIFSDVLAATLRSSERDYVVIMTESDWLRSKVDTNKMAALLRFCEQSRGQVMRLDLTDERAFCADRRHWKGGKVGGVSLVYTPPGSSGMVTFTPSIWARRHLLESIAPGLSMQETESAATRLMARRAPGAVMGVESPVIDRVSVCATGERINMPGFQDGVLHYMRARGWLRRCDGEVE